MSTWKLNSNCNSGCNAKPAVTDCNVLSSDVNLLSLDIVERLLAELSSGEKSGIKTREAFVS